MITSITEDSGTASATAASEPQKAAKKANVAKRARQVAPAKAKSGKKASPAKKAAKGAKKARVGNVAREKGVRAGSKTETILELLKRPGGATAKELLKLTGWQPHSLRGFLSGTIRKKMGLDVVSTKGEDGERSYAVKA